MYDPNSPYETALVSQIVECIAACVKTKGLQSALEDFEGMQNILSSLHIWNLVKQGADAIFAEERIRLEDWSWPVPRLPRHRCTRLCHRPRTA